MCWLWGGGVSSLTTLVRRRRGINLSLVTLATSATGLTQLVVIGACGCVRVCVCQHVMRRGTPLRQTHFVFFSNPLTNYYPHPHPPTATTIPPVPRINKWLDRRPLGGSVIRPLKDLRGNPPLKPLVFLFFWFYNLFSTWFLAIYLNYRLGRCI